MRKSGSVRRSIVATLGCLLLGLVLSPPAAGQQHGVEVVKDITYVVRPGGSLALDAYLPSGPGPHPAALVIPGGRWMFIDKAKNDWLPTQLAEGGIAAFAIEYRPSTDAPFPAALEDAQAAVRFVRAQAARFHIDPTRLGAVGGSAGGHLATLLATWGEGSTEVGTRVRVAISWSGPMDLAPLFESPNANVVNAVETLLDCTSLAACREEARTASPISHVDPSDGAVYLANSTDEIIPVAQARSMAIALERSDLPHELVLLNAGHGLSSAASYKGFDPAFAFLARWIEPDAATGVEPSPSPEKAGASDPSPGAEAPAPKPAEDSATGSDASEDWLPVIAVTALVVATIALLLAIVLLGRAKRLTAGGSTPDASDLEEDESDRLVGSRSDDTR
jgi:acetyl esterase